MSEKRAIDDCFLHDLDRLRHDQALTLLKERLSPIVGSQQVEALGALNHVLAEDITAPFQVPMHTNAAVDGYAFLHESLSDKPISISQRVAAGDLNPASLKPHTAARIFTGAPMPRGADTVAMQEDCTEENGVVSLPIGLKRGANCRLAGEDLKTGETVVEAGTRLKAADLAALASIGVASAMCFAPLRVALFSSGNEMKIPDARGSKAALVPGEVYDANQPLLAALCKTLPIDLHCLGILPDDGPTVREAIEAAAKDFDCIITTGGASRGAEDHMLETLDALGKRHLWQLAVKPGRPMMFGQIPRKFGADCFFFGLPGNPVAAMVCFLLYTRPALLRLAGAKWEVPQRYPLPAGFSITSKKPDRREFLRGRIENTSSGPRLQKFERNGSGLISSLRQSEGFIEVPEDIVSVDKGELLSFIPFYAFD